MSTLAPERPASGAASPTAERRQQMRMRLCTALICVAILLLSLNIDATTNADRVFRETAIGLGAVLALALVLELGAGVRNLLRTDIVMLVALYGLIFLEFLFPQESFTGQVSPTGAQTGTLAALLGFAGIALGRHFPMRFGPAAPKPPRRDLSSARLIQLFLLIAFLGYLHILLAVRFDILEAVRQMAMPRFSQAWARGRVGGLDTFLHETGLLIFLIPPLAGVVFGRARRHGAAGLAIVAAILALTLYKGFAGGTRSVFIVYVITFTVAYLLARPRVTLHEMLMVAVPAVAVTALGTVYMLQFRQIGLANFDMGEIERTTLFVDLNLINIARLTEVFPERYAFLGWEVPFLALVRPIPRALWPGKPEGLSVGIEQALGAEGLTQSASFVGEAFMAGGLLAVTIAGLALGSAAASWDLVERRLGSDFERVLYASGFFAAALAMRSVMQVAPAVLPTLALWIYGRNRGYLG